MIKKFSIKNGPKIILKKKSIRKKSRNYRINSMKSKIKTRRKRKKELNFKRESFNSKK